VAEDFQNRILKSQKPVLMLISHPVKAKNHDIKQKFEQFAKDHKESKNLLVARYHGLNESAEFKNPSKLPAIVMFPV